MELKGRVVIEYPCEEYLHIVQDDTSFTLKEFAKKNQENDNLDKLIEKCKLDYRGKEMSFENMVDDINEFADTLKFSYTYQSHLSLEPLLVGNNESFYKSLKYLSKTENCLQTARYYLNKSYNLISYNLECYWIDGYVPQYIIRSMDFKTAVIWYNNCFDYILQTVFFAFDIYKLHTNYRADMTHEQILKLCSFSSLEKIYSENNTISNFDILYQTLKNYFTQLQTVRNWTNFLKHKGGITFTGLKAPEAIKVTVTNAQTGEIVSESRDFSPIELDLDNELAELQKAHQCLFSCIAEINTFIDYEAARPLRSQNGGITIRDKNSYVKIII